MIGSSSERKLKASTSINLSGGRMVSFGFWTRSSEHMTRPTQKKRTWNSGPTSLSTIMEVALELIHLLTDGSSTSSHTSTIGHLSGQREISRPS